MTDSLKEKMFAGVLWSGVGKVLSMGSNFIIMMVLARALAPSDYGTYVVALTTIVIVAGFGTLGMDQIVARFAAVHVGQKDYAGARSVIIRCLGIVLVGTLASCVAFLWLGLPFFLTVLHIPSLTSYMAVLVVWLLFATFQRQLAETFRGLNDICLATLFGGVRSSGIANGLLACVLISILWRIRQLTLFTALLAMLCASVLVVLTAVLVLWRYIRLREQQEHKDRTPTKRLTTRGALREGWPLWLAALLTTLNNTGSPWLASAIDTSGHVALLGVAQRFVNLIVVPAVIINAVLPPVVSQLYAVMELKRLEKAVRSLSGLLLAPTIVLSAVLVFAGQPLLSLLFGHYYENAYPILVVLCVAQVVSVGTGAWQIVLPMTGARHQMLASSVVSILVQLGLGIGMGYFYGVFGVAFGFCASSIVSNLFGMLLVRRKLGIWTYAAWSWHDVREAVGLAVARLKHREVG